MGVVYEAEQLDLKRVVAVKLLHPAAPFGPEQLTRFRAEAEAAARLHHPNIVGVHDRGEVAGRPYLVMEFVAGENLAARLVQAPLTPRDAARLLAALARAVDFAHKHGVIHRDLKPANIQLTPDGVPKITDFGLAKLLDADGEQTRTGTVFGTPAYMAPEQTAGDPAAVGPPADVHALGAMFYECLTGRPPFQAATALATLDLVHTADPVPPRRLNQQVPADAETVCLKCLQKDPARRYATAAALADDLDRYLGGRPILARPTGMCEHTWKWCRRRPAAAALIAVLSLGTAAGIVGVAAHTDQLRREAERANRGEALADANYRAAREALQKMLRAVETGPRTEIPALKELHREQAENALTFFLAVAAQQDDRPDVRHDAARAAFDAAHLQSLLSRVNAAEVNLCRAAEQFETLIAEFPDVADYRAGRARALNDLGEIRRGSGRYDEALRCHAEALAVRQTLVHEDPGSPIFREELATSHHNLGNVYGSMDRRADAELQYRAAIELRERLLGETPQDREYRRRLAETQLGLSVLLQIGGTRRADAHAAHDQAEGHFEQLLRTDANDFGTAASIATLRLNWAYVLASEGQTDAALADLAKNVATLGLVLNQEPNDANARGAFFRTFGTRAQILAKASRHAEAAADWERVVAQCPSAEREYNRLFLAEALARAGDHRRAVAVTEEAVAAFPKKPAWEHLYHLAGVCGLALTAIKADKTLSSDERDERMARATKLCLELLGQTRAVLGSEKWLDLQKGLATEPKFATLQEHPGFRALLRPE